MSTTSPCFMSAPLRETSWRYAVELTRPGEAASSQVRWAGLGISWLDLTRASSASPPKLVSNPQMRCSGSSIVSLWPSGASSSTDRQCATTSSPGDQACTPGPGAQHDAGEVGADDVVRQVVPLGQRRRAAVPLEERERRDRLEDARPDGVVVDRRGHHGDQRLARPELGRGDLVEVQAASRVLVRGRQAVEHVGLVASHRDAAIRLRHRERREVLRRRVAGQDGVEDVLHDRLRSGRRATSRI